MTLATDIAELNTAVTAVGTAVHTKESAETTRAQGAESTLAAKVGTVTTSAAAPSGGVAGDTWYQV
jgi:hypothetical protein